MPRESSAASGDSTDEAMYLRCSEVLMQTYTVPPPALPQNPYAPHQLRPLFVPGPIPRELCELVSVKILRIEHNALTGKYDVAHNDTTRARWGYGGLRRPYRSCTCLFISHGFIVRPSEVHDLFKPVGVLSLLSPLNVRRYPSEGAQQFKYAGRAQFGRQQSHRQVPQQKGA